MRRRKIPLVERAGDKGRPLVKLAVRTTIMQLLNLGVSGNVVVEAIAHALGLAGTSLDGELSNSTVYNIQQEMGVVASAHVAQEWLRSQDPENIISQADGTTSRLQNIQVS